MDSADSVYVAWKLAVGKKQGWVGGGRGRGAQCPFLPDCTHNRGVRRIRDAGGAGRLALELEDGLEVDLEVEKQVDGRVEGLKVGVVDPDPPALEDDERDLATHEARLWYALVAPLREDGQLHTRVVGQRALERPQARRAEVRVGGVDIPTAFDVTLLTLLLRREKVIK